MKTHKPHGHKRRHLFKVGDLVRWNRWYLGDIRAYGQDGSTYYNRIMTPHLGIILKVYVGHQQRCWVADINFMDTELNENDWSISQSDENVGKARQLPIACLEILNEV